MSIRSSGWMDQAACLDVGADLFFAPERERQQQKQQREAAAREICAGCPVKWDCLALSLGPYGAQIYTGIWAGMDERERAREKRSRIRRGGLAA